MTQADRISLSKSIVYAVPQYLAATASIAAISGAATVATNLDTANKNLFATQNTSVTGYENELQYLTGTSSKSIVEQDLINAANSVSGNIFYPNGVPLIWTLLVPYALTGAQGLPTTAFGPGSEASLNSALLTLISGLHSAMSPALGSPLAPLTAALNTYYAFLNNELTSINLSDTFHGADAAIAHANIITFQNAIDTWGTYLIGTGYTTYPNSADAGLATFTANLAILDAAVAARGSFVSTRTGQLEGYLGTLSQDPTTGIVTSATTGNGSYFARYQYINARLSLMNGSLTQSQGLSRSVGAQNSSQTTIKANVTLWFNSIVASQFIADANNTNVININAPSYYTTNLGVTPSTWMINGDSVFVVADNQPEISTTISSIITTAGGGQQVTLSTSIPQIYLKGQYARLYKTLV